LTDDREADLNDIGFVWDAHSASWQERYQALRAFAIANGHCNIPATVDKALNVWCKHQRRQYKCMLRQQPNVMTEERIRALNEIGFNWNPRNLNH